MELLVYPVTVFCLGMPEMQVSHICIKRALDLFVSSLVFLKGALCCIIKRNFK